MYSLAAMSGQGWPRWAALLAASLGLLGLAVSYLGGMRLIVESSEPGSGYTQDERDGLYLAIHGATLMLALVVGYVLGYVARRQGIAWAALFVTFAVVLMAGALIGSRELACEGDMNGLIRHWQCSR